MGVGTAPGRVTHDSRPGRRPRRLGVTPAQQVERLKELDKLRLEAETSKTKEALDWYRDALYQYEQDSKQREPRRRIGYVGVS